MFVCVCLEFANISYVYFQFCSSLSLSHLSLPIYLSSLFSVEVSIGQFVAFGDAVRVAGDPVQSAILDPLRIILQLALVRAVIHHGDERLHFEALFHQTRIVLPISLNFFDLSLLTHKIVLLFRTRHITDLSVIILTIFHLFIF